MDCVSERNAPVLPENLAKVPEIAGVEGVEDCSAVIDGVRWRYLHAGSGPALLVVHGFMGYSFSWRFVMKGLAEHYSVYAVDLPGCGFSQRCTRLPGTLASDAESLLRLMDHFGMETCDILGTSRGGGLAIALAGLLAERGMPQRMRRVVLSAPINPWSRIGLGRIRLLRTRGGRTFALQVVPRMPVILRKFFRDLYFEPDSIPPDSFAGYRAGLEPPGSFLHLWNIARSWTNDLQRIGDVLPRVETVPALLLWGDHDRAVDPASAGELHRRWKNSAVVMMARIGHMPYEEAPAEFNRIVLDFLLRGRPLTAQERETPGEMAHTSGERGST